MKFDRLDYEGAPAGKVAPVTEAQRAMMQRSFTLQAEMAQRAGETKDAERWRRLAEAER